MWRTFIGALMLLFLIMATSFAQSNRRDVTAKEFGEKWPLTVDKGTVACYEGRAAVFIEGANAYALNGTAQCTKKYRDIRPIWKDDPKIPGVKVSIAPLTDAALKLCR